MEIVPKKRERELFFTEHFSEPLLENVSNSWFFLMSSSLINYSVWKKHSFFWEGKEASLG